MKDNLVYNKSKDFAFHIIQQYRRMNSERTLQPLANQMLRSGTSVGANIAEGINAQSTADFISKLSISLKEATETRYWLELLHMSEAIDDERFQTLHTECSELMKLLTKIIKTTKEKDIF